MNYNSAFKFYLKYSYYLFVVSKKLKYFLYIFKKSRNFKFIYMRKKWKKLILIKAFLV